jgi:hypothetical protein
MFISFQLFHLQRTSHFNESAKGHFEILGVNKNQNLYN